MATIDRDAYVQQVIRYTERICDDLGLLRRMLQILTEDESDYDGSREDNRPFEADQLHDARNGQAE